MNDTYEAARRLQGRWDHYMNCGLYVQGIITIAKSRNDPTRICTCGLWDAIDALEPRLRALKKQEASRR